MAITRGVGPVVQQTLPGNNLVLTLNSTTVGRSIVIVVVWFVDAGQTISQITISGESNASIVAGSKYTRNSGGEAGQFAYLANNTAGGNKTITVTMSAATYFTAAAMEYAGLDTSSQPDNSTTATGGAPGITASLTTTTANALICAVAASDQIEPTAGSGFTLWGTLLNTNVSEEVEDQLDAGVTGSKTVTFGTVSGGNWAIGVVSFKAAAGAAGWGGLLGHKANRLVVPLDM